MKIYTILLTGLCLIYFEACSLGKKPVKTSEVIEVDTNVLDWPGTYFGVLPCSGCEGIETELTLMKDGHFIMSKQKIGKEVTSDTVEGVFEWNENKTNISLGILIPGYSPTLFKVTKNAVVVLDDEGGEMTGNHATQYTLVKSGNPDIEDKRWQISELFGRPVEGKPDSDFIVFHSKDQKIIAKAHCNMLQFDYKILFQNQIRAVAGPSTKMACPDSMEENLIRAVSSSDKITLDNNKLMFWKANTMLAKCVPAP